MEEEDWLVNTRAEPAVVGADLQLSALQIENEKVEKHNSIEISGILAMCLLANYNVE